MASPEPQNSELRTAQPRDSDLAPFGESLPDTQGSFESAVPAIRSGKSPSDSDYLEEESDHEFDESRYESEVDIFALLEAEAIDSLDLHVPKGTKTPRGITGWCGGVPTEEQVATEKEEDVKAEMQRIYDLEMTRIMSMKRQFETVIQEYLSKKHKVGKKGEFEGLNDPQDQLGPDAEQRYHNLLRQSKELRQKIKETKRHNVKVLFAEKAKLAEKISKRDELRNKYVQQRREIAAKCEYARTGKPLPPKILRQIEDKEVVKEKELEKVRTKNISLRATLKKLEQTMVKKEELGDGLHLIDFEQLKIENQAYNEKIEERNEDLLKLRKKITTTVLVLSHLKEKLQFILNENQELKKKLADLGDEVAEKRDSLASMKQKRDRLRAETNALQRQAGLIAHPDLLTDFDDQTAEIDRLELELQTLKNKHTRLTNGIKEKKKASASKQEEKAKKQTAMAAARARRDRKSHV
eukprot:TRINITY_DN2355_c0_g1_i1.p1 TRINITY_DN2355_c0_g1~~TRINITY_DN2355_c0_g1_i1.p1  ORF type:complete len:467 (-),score=122.86 TRINITY_DN2355_c0_g1_i1:114-1514(-)